MNTIKSITNSFYLFCLLLVSAGCNNTENFLNESPTGFADPNTLLKDKKGAEIFTIGTYDATRVLASDMNGWLSMWGTLAADEICTPNWGALSKPVYLHTLSPSNATVRSIWENLYISVNKANSAIDRISIMTEDKIDLESRNQLVGESRFVRAMLYFALVSSWENIPLVKNETTNLEDIQVAQSTPKEVYNFIVNDLLFAESVLSASQGGGRATKGAAQALLSKVYLQMTGFPLYENDKYGLAETKLKEVIDGNTYEILDFYPSVFALDNEQNKEMIFAIGFDGPGINQGGSLGTFYGPNGNVINGGQSGNNWFVNWELAGTSAPLPIGSGSWGARNNYPFAQGYHDDDIRSRNNVAKHNVNQGPWTAEDGMYNEAARKSSLTGRRATWKPWKWHNIRPSNWGSDTPYDQPYIRYSDVLLMYAEALNGQGKLTQTDVDMTVNKLRMRATKWPSEVKDQEVAPLMILASMEENATEILSERRKELCFEGWRRNDLIRFGKYTEAINVTQPSWSNSGNPATQFSDFEIRWPIPSNELQLNSELVQNPGY